MSFLFAAFDVFPSSKGAGTHIAHKVRAIEKIFGRVNLAVLGYGDMPEYQEEGDITIWRCLSYHPNFLKRTEYYWEFISKALQKIGRDLQIIQFRDIWSGMPLLSHEYTKDVLKIFEVNGLPSIELPYHYPGLMKNKGLMSKIKAKEDYCLRSADGIITVSSINKRNLINRNVDPDKIIVLPNTADPCKDIIKSKKKSLENYILYAGTLSAWQGLPVLIKAFKMISEINDTRLYIAASTKKNLKPIRKLIRKTGLDNKVTIKVGLSKQELFELYKNALFSTAPLTRCSRNILQGCSPLKIIESMSVGTPVVASNLAVCAEIIENRKDGILVSPDSPRAMANAMTELINNRELLSEISIKAGKKIESTFNIESWRTDLKNTYKNFLDRRDRNNGKHRIAI